MSTYQIAHTAHDGAVPPRRPSRVGTRRLPITALEPGLKSVEPSDYVCLAPEAALNDAERFATISEPVFLLGETGTGRIDLAYHIYSLCKAACNVLIVVRCGSLGELPHEFAFPAEMSLPQFLEFRPATDSITFVFDKVDEIPFHLQSDCLRAVQQILVAREPASHPPIITTASYAIFDLLDSGAFRRELFYQLNVLQIELPPLRERKEEIEALGNRLLDIRRSTEPRRFSAGAVKQLSNYDWPGNLLELRNVVSSVDALSDSIVIDEEELFRHWKPVKRNPKSMDTGMSLEDAETQLILDTIERFNGNKTKAAEQLGITTRTLHNKIRKFRQLGLMP